MINACALLSGCLLAIGVFRAMAGTRLLPVIALSSEGCRQLRRDLLDGTRGVTES